MGLLGPAAFGMLVFVAVPAVAAIVISLYDWRPLSGRAEFVGLENLRTLLADDQLWAAVANTARYTAVVVPGALLVGLAGALSLRAVRRGRGLYKALYFFPVAATLAATSIAWRWSFQSGGRLDPIGGWFGIDDWLGDSNSGLAALAIVGIWRESAFCIVFFTASLAAVPGDQLDAARVDGANAVGTFTSVLWPALRPGLVASIVLVTEHSVGVFDPVAIITNGGPAGGTKTVGYLLWERSVRFQDYDGGAVVGLVLLVFMLLVTALQLLVVRRWSGR